MVKSLAENAKAYDIGEQVVWDPANLSEFDQDALFDIQLGDIEKRQKQAETISRVKLNYQERLQPHDAATSPKSDIEMENDESPN